MASVTNTTPLQANTSISIADNFTGFTDLANGNPTQIRNGDSIYLAGITDGLTIGMILQGDMTLGNITTNAGTMSITGTRQLTIGDGALIGNDGSIVIINTQIVGSGTYSTFGDVRITNTNNTSTDTITVQTGSLTLTGDHLGDIVLDGTSFILFGSGATMTGTIGGEGSMTLSNFASLAGNIAFSGASTLLLNSGTRINGTTDGSAFDDTVTNNGVIGNDMDLGRGNDTLTNNGSSLFNVVDMGLGDDTVTNSNRLTTINLGGGDDSYTQTGTFSQVTDRFLAGAGNDDVTIQGGTVAARIMLGLGNDVFLDDGANLDDRVWGEDGADSLSGNAGDDYLNGGDGDDTIEGGTGRDRLVGGAGADTFVFAVGDSGFSGGTRDLIEDFTQGEDIIDLGTILGFFIGSGDLSGIGFSEVRSVISGGYTYVFYDENGDGVSDLSISLRGNFLLTSADFDLGEIVAG